MICRLDQCIKLKKCKDMCIKIAYCPVIDLCIGRLGTVT